MVLITKQRKREGKIANDAQQIGAQYHQEEEEQQS